MARRIPNILHSLFPRIIWNVDSNRREIALTFDDGPTEEVTDYALNELGKREMKATFFMVGRNIDSNPDLLKRIVDDEHRIGNHTHDHNRGWRTSCRDYIESVQLADSVMKEAGINPSNLFRPPYGQLTLNQYYKLRSDWQVVMWSLMAYDFDMELAPDKCLQSLISKTRSGDIVVFHDNAKACNTLKLVLPRYLDFLQDNDFRSVTL